MREIGLRRDGAERREFGHGEAHQIALAGARVGHIIEPGRLGRGGHRGGLAEVGGFHDRHIGRHRAGEHAPGSTPVSRPDRTGGWTRSFPPNGSKPNWAGPTCGPSLPPISFPNHPATPAPASRPPTSPPTRPPPCRPPPLP